MFSIFPLSTSTNDFIDLNFSSATIFQWPICSISCYNNLSFQDFFVLSSSLNFSIQLSMCFYLKDCCILVFSSQLIFSKNSTCLIRYYFSLANFLFQIFNLSFNFSTSCIYLMIFLFSPSTFLRFSFYSSKCSLNRSHSPSLTRTWVYNISMRIFDVLSSLSLYLFVLVRLYIEFLGRLSPSKSRISDLSNLSMKLKASLWIQLSFKGLLFATFFIYCDAESSLDRFESNDLSLSDLFLLNFFGLSYQQQPTFFVVFSPDQINFQLIYQLLFFILQNGHTNKYYQKY